jgi:hypothetical protein
MSWRAVATVVALLISAAAPIAIRAVVAVLRKCGAYARERQRGGDDGDGLGTDGQAELLV